MYCDLYLHYIRAPFHRVGIEYAARPGNIMHGIQLYQAVQQGGLLLSSQKCRVLDAILESQGNSTFFVEDPPKSPEADFKNLFVQGSVSGAMGTEKEQQQTRGDIKG
ncbi:hypothetical protein ColLi_03442 [Colletotrichum liriopes]|uniref:Uncharacterized protein n=1 Tax=Colletotrichum liriopes TaxID=708192 RepID=A0AA37LPY8_9PEZI|nr:hypothetical protein ColLi_03442 [Colletotrichum liriopes]